VGRDDDDDDDNTRGGGDGAPDVVTDQHTSPTADLSRMGRAPIHYACMSFRGLDIAAFRLLLDETLREGNVWVWDGIDDGEDEDDLDYYESELHSSLMNEGSKVMEEEDENENGEKENHIEARDDTSLCEFETEVDRELYQYPTSLSMDDLTIDGSKKDGKNCRSQRPIKVLVNVMGIKDATGQTPLGLLFRRYRERVRCVINTVDKIRRESMIQQQNCNPNDRDHVGNGVDRAALVAAVRVHADLGELWEKARWIVARLTEERLLREQMEQPVSDQNQVDKDDDIDIENDLEAYHHHTCVRKNRTQVIPPVRRDATSRRATYYGGSAKAVAAVTTGAVLPSSSLYDYSSSRNVQNLPSHRRIDPSTYGDEPPSPVAQEAASWAVELHPTRPKDDDTSLILPFAPDISTNMLLNDRYLPVGKLNEQHKDSNPTQSSLQTKTTSNGLLQQQRRMKQNQHNFRIVHASVGLTGYGCPPELIRLAISIHPNQVMEMDQDGNLPIHIAVTAASYLANANPVATPTTTSTTAPAMTPSHIETVASSYWNNSNSNTGTGGGGGGGDDHSSVMSDAAMSFFSSATVSQTSNPFDKVIKILLQHYPAGARTPQGKSGRLPLVLAVESKGKRTWEDGIRTLLNAYPPALHNKKVIEPILYPHVLSLVANNGLQQTTSSSVSNGGEGAFDFSGYVDVLPNCQPSISTTATAQPSPTMTTASNVVSSSNSQFGQSYSLARTATNNIKSTQRISQRTIRQETCSRTTLFELLRSKPEWLTRGFVHSD
jgi:hypothetical protein